MKFIQDNKAFTLMEIIITVSVIAILAVSVFSLLKSGSRTGKAKDVQRYQDVTAIAKAVELYQIDNDALPSDLSATSISTGEKFVLCNSTATLSCDGQSKTCLVINDTDFLDNYLGGTLPVDPDKSSTADTGYYITRTDTKMTFGSCNTYEEDTIEYIAKAKLDYVCGDGIVDATEVCDDGNVINEGCANGIIEDVSSGHCNSTCTATLPDITGLEPCDYDYWSADCRINGTTWYTVSDVGGPSYCNVTCTAEISSATTCDDAPPPV